MRRYGTSRRKQKEIDSRGEDRSAQAITQTLKGEKDRRAQNQTAGERIGGAKGSAFGTSADGTLSVQRNPPARIGRTGVSATATGSTAFGGFAQDCPAGDQRLFHTKARPAQLRISHC